jgi:bromodomain adjacent to zinc finger domain protein 1A
MAWFNPKGIRELALKNALQKWMPHLTGGMRRRASVRKLLLASLRAPSLTVSFYFQDLEVQAKIPDARRSERMRNIPGAELVRQPYMLWSNRRAVSTA